MGIAHFSKFILTLAIATSAYAQDTSVQTLSEGACWYEQGEVLRLASFNDKESVAISRDEIEFQVEGLLGMKKGLKPLTSELALHCGGYGSSLVIKTEFENRPVCLWVKFNKGRLAIRSLGGLEETKSELCDGYKWGELIVGAKDISQKALLETESFHSMIKSVSVISGTTLKVVLHESFYGREAIAMKDIKKQIDLKYIELNFYQHPVGEATALK